MFLLLLESKTVVLGIQFLKRGIFPAIPWSIWTLPGSQGGLGVLDVKTQYFALYFRWIQPLLSLPNISSSNDPLVSMLMMHIQNINRIHHHQLPLLLPSSRRSFFRKGRVSTIDSIYRSIDALPRNFDNAIISPATALQLPLLTVLYTVPSGSVHLPAKAKDMVVDDVFQYNADYHFLHWKDPSDESLRRWQRAPRKIFNKIQSGDIRLQPFLQRLCHPAPSPGSILPQSSSVDFSPFALQFGLPNGHTVMNKVPTKTFRQACASNTHIPSYLSNIQSSAWEMFWALSLNMIQRNVVYRFITNTIPHKSLLHRIFPASHPTSFCVHCNTNVESAEHFLFYCPVKTTIWQAVVFEFLWPTVSIHDIITAIQALDFSDICYSQKPSVHAHVIVFIALANIWKAHFRLIFSQTPFTSSSVLNCIRVDILQRIDEDQVHQML